MKNIKTAIIGTGNVARAMANNLSKERNSDFSLVGVIRRTESMNIPLPEEFERYNVTISDKFSDLKKLGVEVAFICVPNGLMPATTEEVAKLGICAVDSYDSHNNAREVVAHLDNIAKQNKTVLEICAGWDIGSDSIIRAIMARNDSSLRTDSYFFGPGFSRGHRNEAMKAAQHLGLIDCESLTLPPTNPKENKQDRVVYAVVKEGADKKAIYNAIKSIVGYFDTDKLDLEIVTVDVLNELKTKYAGMHGVHITKKSLNGEGNISQDFIMKGKNVEMTVNNLLHAGRRALVLKEKGWFGAYLPTFWEDLGFNKPDEAYKL